MSRSKHQRHKFFHNRRNPHPFRRRKIKPYGLKGWCGYGGEYYRKKLGEVCIDLVNKKQARTLAKKLIKQELNDTVEW